MRKLLVLTDYPIGFPSGFGETLFNLLEQYPENKLWNAYPGHLNPSPEKARGQPYRFDAPMRPNYWPQALNNYYYPILKIKQLNARRRLFNELCKLIKKSGITALLTCPVSPWL